eukprot:COSAG01_NODE_1039_length_11962_cov_32.853494_13_plen_187_part_00
MKLTSISVGSATAAAEQRVAMPIDLNLAGSVNMSAAQPWRARRGGQPGYVQVMPENYELFINAPANVEALVRALEQAGFVNFPPGSGTAQQAGFWRGTEAIPGAQLSAAAQRRGQGVWLHFDQGASVLIDTDALFADIAGQGLKLVGVMTRRAMGYTLVGLSAFVNNVVLFDHANRRMGFVRGKEW